MIGKILTGIMKLIISLVSVLLQPIDLLIASTLPGLGNAFSGISAMFNSLSNVMGWVIDTTLLSSETISLIVLYYTFALTVPLAISTIKLAIRWYNALKP